MSTLLATQCSLDFVYTSINNGKIKFIPYIYIPFSQNRDEKTYISARSEGVKHEHAVCFLSAEQRRQPIRL